MTAGTRTLTRPRLVGSSLFTTVPRYFPKNRPSKASTTLCNWLRGSILPLGAGANRIAAQLHLLGMVAGVDRVRDGADLIRPAVPGAQSLNLDDLVWLED